MTNARIGGLVLLGFLVFVTLCPELAHAQFSGGGDLQNKVGGITRGLTNILLPAASCIGMIYAAVLAATGDASAKSRMVLIGFCSLVGFLAPLIIQWLQKIAN